MNNLLYPLKFETQFKEKIWGGTKILDVLGKDFGDLPNCGETWEISGVAGNISVVKEGPLKGRNLTDLLTEFKGDFVGESVYNKYGNEFPLLIKFIDANEDLSVQVHPNDEVARARHNSFGKTEMWYVLQADPNASLISGFSKQMSREQYAEYLSTGQIMSVLNRESVESGDVFFIPAGRVHTIGKGLLIAEIQQTSDLTYRIYDFDRVDANGSKRELHNALALDVIDYNKYPNYKSSYTNSIDQPIELAKCQYFETRKYNLTKNTQLKLGNIDSFEILIGIEGEFAVRWTSGETKLTKGEVILLPVCNAEIEIESLNPISTFLRTSVPRD